MNLRDSDLTRELPILGEGPAGPVVDEDRTRAIGRAEVRALAPTLTSAGQVDHVPLDDPEAVRDLLGLPKQAAVEPPPAPDPEPWTELANDTALLAAGVRELVVIARACRLPIGSLRLVPDALFEPLIVHSVRDGSEGERRAEVDRVAELLGVRAVADYPDVELQHATYAAERSFGPVTYRVQTHLDAPPLPSAIEADVDWEAARREYFVDDLAGLEQPRRLPPSIVNPPPPPAVDGEPTPVDNPSCVVPAAARRRRARRGRRTKVTTR